MTKSTLEPIAVIGMGCKFPGANSPEEYWDLLDAGRVMTTEPPPARFPTKSHARSTEQTVFLSNFLDDIASFDHRFFHKSSREAASMDPQQRILLQVAYHTLASSGFFSRQQHDEVSDVGCFVGVCASDYDENVASHPANAFSALGTLRAFVTGRVSHFFGLSGPSITFDTACSSSAVAIDAACKAIRNGDCSSALAGGVSIFTSPHLYQNLAAASFLSPTGTSKSFDASADGYSRGEGFGLVMLKSLKQAEADGDCILGTILSSSVQQSSNKVPIMVPYSPSQTALYRRVLRLAGVSADQVSYLEAHGTGTAVGDAHEFEGIREVFGTETRQSPLYFSSVKGNIGHTEGASGVAGLIKLMLMMYKGAIPRQASHVQPNPKMRMNEKLFCIPNKTVHWKTDVKIACLNNFGASGCIAALVVQEYPRSSAKTREPRTVSFKYPILVTGNSSKSLMDNCYTLGRYLDTLQPKGCHKSLGNLAFELAKTQNQSMRQAFMASVSSVAELKDQLRIAASDTEKEPCLSLTKAPNPVVLLFGGQTNRFIGLDHDTYQNCTLLRRHLDECDTLLKSFGHSGLYPMIFSIKPIDDVVTLQSAQFSLHYACAQSWLDSGLKVDCVIGHSFGQLVALTVSGVLSLEDGLRLAHDRALLMQRYWGSERGAMVALNADYGAAARVMAAVKKDHPDSGLELACYNGPHSHVLVGSKAEIECAVAVLDQSPTSSYKVLSVTHGFHSRFCNPIIPHLEELSSSLVFHQPTIHLETTSSLGSWDKITPKLIAEHMRHPVYFADAIKRIKARYGSCTWVEAGSNSSVTTIARRCLVDVGKGNSDLFFPINLSRKDSLTLLADTTVNMWKNAHNVQFWPCHRDQRRDYDQIMLPPYEFEKTRHWLEFESEWQARTLSRSDSRTELKSCPEPDPVLVTLQGFAVDGGSKRATFIVNPRCEEWKVLVAGHAVLQQPLCPAALYMELIARAARELATIQRLDAPAVPTLRGLQMVSPLGLSSAALLEIVLTPTDTRERSWEFTFQSRDRSANGSDSPNCHAKGSLQIPVSDEETSMEMSRISRLLRPQCLADSLLRQPGHEAVRGSVVYGVFSRAVQYHDFYRGVREVTSTQDGTLMARVVLAEGQPEAVTKDSLTNPVAVDNFLQVPGIYANCLAPCPSDEAYVCTGIDYVQFAAGAAVHELEQHYDVYVISSPVSDKTSRHDVFALHHSSNEPIFIAQGVKFHRVRVSSLAKTLARANKNESDGSNLRVEDHLQSDHPSATDRAPVPSHSILPTTTERYEQRQDDLRRLLSEVTDVPLHMIQGNVKLEDLGIDSLMATEIISVIGKVFGQNIPQEKWRDLQTFASLCECLAFSNSPDQPSSTPTGKTQEGTLETSAAAVLPVRSPPTVSESMGYRLSNLTCVLRKLLATHLDCDSDRLTPTTNLADAGLDSLLCIELIGDVNKLLGVKVDLSQMTMESTFHHLVQVVVDAMHAAGLSVDSATTPARLDSGLTTLAGSPAEWDSSACEDPAAPRATVNYGDRNADLTNAPEAFESVKTDLPWLADRNQLTGFYEKVMDRNSELVLSYTVEAFVALGVDLNQIDAGEKIPQITVLPKHASLRAVLYEILREAQIADFDGSSYLRSDKALGLVSSRTLFDNIVQDFPQHAKEHQLLDLCGAELAELLSGQKNPLTVLFGSKQNRDILEDVYSASPVHLTMSQMLTSFLERTLRSATPGPGGVFRILELGAGTGATTKWVVERLVKLGVPIEYTFTDISISLVNAGKRKFAKYDCMRFKVMDIERPPRPDCRGQFDIVLSTNCIHATSNLRNSLGNIGALLRPNGFVSLVELTTRLYWLDLVFGLLDGWWLFSDGRKHALTAPESWAECMTDAGFGQVSWTGDSTKESELSRVITGFKGPSVSAGTFTSVPQNRSPKIETLVFKHADGVLPLRADIYLPDQTQARNHDSWAIGEY
jgi:acyl transferase domain-containing protein/acyl carrier protein/SAM-dependent methyltransferase